MHTRKRGALVAALAFALLLAGGATAAAQDEGGASRQQPAARGEVNYEVQLHLLVTAEGAEASPRVPQALDAVVRQLKTTLPAADYRLAAAFVNRVRDGGGFNVKSMGAPPYAGPPQGAQGGPWNTTFQFSLNGVRAADDAAGERFVRVQGLSFNVRVPVPVTPAGGQGLPVINHEDVGISTQVSLRDGEPALVGTLNTSRPGQIFALVVTVRRAR